MKVKINRYLVEVYKPWGGAKAVWERMSDEDLEKIEEFMDNEWLDDRFGNWDETSINDFFWFDDETWLEIIGENEDSFYNRPRQRELN